MTYTLGPGSCPQVAQGLVRRHRHRAETWPFDVRSATETPRKEWPALQEKRMSHRIWADEGVSTQRGEKGTRAEGTVQPM